MGFLTTMKANKAYRLHAKGDLEAAKQIYEQVYAEGLNDPKLLMTYAMLLLREGDYEHAVEVLRKADKAPGVTADQKNQIVAHFAVAIWKQGRLERALELLRELFRKGKTGMIYGMLGFLLIERADALRLDGDPPATPEEIQAAKDEAVAFNREAVEYDEDDPVALDNLAQAYYRLLGDKAAARPYFDRALKLKPGAIDTNYFLALYDVEQGDAAAAAEKLELAAEGRFSPMNYATREMVQALLGKLKGIG